ncbi:MAG: hypothetical protein KY476_09350 [Planctomycetes bacterium]|nr:hypothetical protein [Planctomycetota bacterium]
MAALLPHSRLLSDRAAAHVAWRAGEIPVVCVAEFLEREEPLADQTLPESWEVTGDSIAAWIARRWPAERLVLVKSTSPTVNKLESAASCGLVDPWFGTVAGEIASLAWVNLRSEAPAVEPWPL